MTATAIRAIVLISLVAIAYITVSVYFYGKGITELFMLLWLPLIIFNTWAVASALPQDTKPAINRIVGMLVAVVLAGFATIVFMTIAFNLYGT
jgi:hypothetical protein